MHPFTQQACPEVHGKDKNDCNPHTTLTFQILPCAVFCFQFQGWNWRSNERAVIMFCRFSNIHSKQLQYHEEITFWMCFQWWYDLTLSGQVQECIPAFAGWDQEVAVFLPSNVYWKKKYILHFHIVSLNYWKHLKIIYNNAKHVKICII